MNKLIFLFPFFLIITSFPLWGNTKAGPTGLMVEFLRDPSQGFVNEPLPNFSWILNDAFKGAQKSYSIKVSSSEKNLLKGFADVWNSGEIISEESVNVKYRGVPLKPLTTYFWNVMVKIGLNNNTGTSEIQEFKTGSFAKGTGSSVMPLVKHTILPLREIKINSKGNYFVDFGKAAFGTVRVCIESQKSDSIRIHLGEKAEASERVNRNPGGTIRYRYFSLNVEKGTHLYTINIPHIQRHTKYPAINMPSETGEVTPFRYCEIEINSPLIHCKSVEQIATNYFWQENESYFSCSDTVLNQVWDLCKYTIKATSFCGVYVDGDRERIPYEADAYINQLGHYCTDREYSMARFSHEYLINNPTWPTEWIMQSVMIAYTDYLYTGDNRSLVKFYKDLKFKSLISLARSDGLISTRTGLLTETLLNDIHIHGPIKDIVDWPAIERDNNEMPEVSTVVNAFHYESLFLMARIANAVGEFDDERFFKERAQRVKNSINNLLFSQTEKKYLDGQGSAHSSLHANIFPLAFGIVPDNIIPEVVKFINLRGMACSVYGAQYLLEALYTAGEDNSALNLMRSKGERSWWNMINLGSTITMEAWDAKFKPNLDWNHAWGAVPANMIKVNPAMVYKRILRP